MLGLTLGVIFGAFIMNPDMGQVISRLRDFPSWASAASGSLYAFTSQLSVGTSLPSSRSSRIFVLFEKNKEASFLAWLKGASSLQIEPLTKDDLNQVKKGDVVLHVHRVVSQKLEGFWDKNLFTAAADATGAYCEYRYFVILFTDFIVGGSAVFVSLRSVDPNSASPPVFPSGIPSGVAIQSPAGGDRVHLEFRHGLQEDYENEYNRAMLAKIEGVLNK
jgi:hypothetical protein